MTRANEQYAYFTVTGDFEPEAITEVLGLQPTDAWKKGDRNETTHYERKFSRWSLRSRRLDIEKLEDHIRDVLNQLAPHADRVKQLVFDLGMGELVCVGYFHSDYPGFHLDRETITAMAHMNLELDCDFYYLYSDRRDDS